MAVLNFFQKQGVDVELIRQGIVPEVKRYVYLYAHHPIEWLIRSTKRAFIGLSMNNFYKYKELIYFFRILVFSLFLEKSNIK